MKQLIKIMSILFCSVGYSQITYTSVNYADVTDSFHVSKANIGLSSFDFTQTGANFSWNYATLPVNQQRDIEWIDPANGGYQNAWCASNSILLGCVSQFANYTNLARYRIDSLNLGSLSLTNVINHYNKTTTVLEYKMQGATINIGNIPVSIATQYIDTDTIYNFPLNYNDQDSSTSKYEIDLNTVGAPFRYVANRERINSVEGWGSLTTPFGNFASVLKVKTIIRKSDTIYTDSTTIPVIDTLVEYKWFDATYGIPVLQADGNYILGTEVITAVTYIDGIRCIKPSPFFAYNPLLIQFDTITNSADVNFINLSSNADSSYWDFGDGTTSVLNSPPHTYYCPGVYWVDLHVTNQFCTPDSTDSITLPVIVLDTNNRLRSFNTVSICDSANINGNWYYSSQIVVDTVQSLSLTGCDSLVVTNLQITIGSNTPTSATVCKGDSYIFPDGTTQTGITSQIIYQSIFTGANNCDSIITTTVNVLIIDTTLSVSNDTILSVGGYDQYQWYLCSNGSLLVNETNNYIIPPDTYGYYVEITNSDGCTETSACESVSLGLTIESNDIENINLYPNPVKNIFTIEWEIPSNIVVEITNLHGLIVSRDEYKGVNKINKNISDFSSGTYFVTVYNTKIKTVFKIVRE